MYLNQVAPRLSVEDAVCIAREHYGLGASAKSLDSHLDQNFLLSTDRGKFVLKVANAALDPRSIDLQQQVLMHLAAGPNGVRHQKPVWTAGGRPTAVVGEHKVWLVTYLDGRMLTEAKPRTPGLLRSLGGLIGRLDRRLMDFTHPYARREYFWDLRLASTLREYMHHIPDSARRSLVDRMLSRFEADTLPQLPGLRCSPIHNDANDANIVVDGLGYEARATGIIDFGDLLVAPAIFEVAIAATYMMLGEADPIGVAAEVVRGYHEEFPLFKAELEVLLGLICTRLSCSVLVSAFRATVEPENAYVRVSEARAWELLERLSNLSPALALYRFREACEMEPCPKSPRVVLWLRAHRAEFAPVMQPDVRTSPPAVLDFGVESLLTPRPGEALDPHAAARTILDAIHRAGAEIGLGRYDEVRLVYNADAFLSAHGERRTVHLGIDLFQETGSVVYAPIDAVVEGCGYRKGHLDYGGFVVLRHEAGDDVFFTLYGHLSPDFDLEPGQAVRRGQQIGRLGSPEENGGWAPHLHFQVICDLLDTAPAFPGVALPSQRRTWLSLCPDPNHILGVQRRAFPAQALGMAEVLALRARHIGASLSVSYRRPLHILRGYRQFLYDADGQAYLDAVNNVPHVGHCHPRVVRAAQRQMEVLCTNTRYVHETLVNYAGRLARTMPGGLDVCIFVNSGSEANDLALRMAFAHTGMRDVIVLDGAYHGHLSSLIDISPYKFDGPGGRGAPAHVHKVVRPDGYRGPYFGMDVETGSRFAAHVDDAIKALGRGGRKPAAFISESLLGCGGQIEFPRGYLAAVYRHVRSAGAVCIADEVQVGFGRVGTHFWGFETQNAVPDIVVLGKPMGNGHPLAAVVTTKEIAAAFDNGMEFFSTFGGNNVSCEVGMAVLDVIEEEHLQENALATGEHLKNCLRALQTRHETIGDVRGRGLFLGVELVRNRSTRVPAPQSASYAANRLRDLGVLVSTDGPHNNVLKIKPPMVFDVADADKLTHTLDQTLSEEFVRLRVSPQA